MPAQDIRIDKISKLQDMIVHIQDVLAAGNVPGEDIPLQARLGKVFTFSKYIRRQHHAFFARIDDDLQVRVDMSQLFPYRCSPLSMQNQVD